MLRILGALAVVCGLFLLLAKACAWNAESVTIHNRKVLGNLIQGDTLRLTATFSECGEWGGHRERIHIYATANSYPADKAGSASSKKHFTAVWLLDTIGCQRPTRRFFVAGRQEKLTAAEEAMVAGYIERLAAYGKRKQDIPPISGNVFLVIGPKGQIQLRVLDWKQQWQGFDSLRNRLFKPNQLR
jgi:hypothetical protein